MNTELERRKQEITRTQGRRKLWQRIVSALAAVVMFVTTYVLILPVEAQNRTFCEMEAHEHSAENGCYVETKTLKCEVKHEHTDECYITLLTLICQHEEHTHNKECYADKTADVETQQDWEASIKSAKLTGNWSEDILAIANTQLGYRESDKNYIVNEKNEIQGYNRYAAWVSSTNAEFGQYSPWSAAFVAFCLHFAKVDEAELQRTPYPAQWGELMKAYEKLNADASNAQPGDILFIDANDDEIADRVAIVVENNDGKIKAVEGDLNNSVAYAEYILGDASAASRTAQADVDSSNEESNSKDFAEAKSTTGRTVGRIIGFVAMPENPDYTAPIDTLDPENTTAEPENREKTIILTAMAENGVTVTLTADADAFDAPANELELSVSVVDDEKALALLKQAAADTNYTDNESADSALPAQTAEDFSNKKSDNNRAEGADKDFSNEKSNDNINNDEVTDAAAKANLSTLILDIKVLYNKEETQPKEGKTVKITLSGDAVPGGSAEVFYLDMEHEAAENMNATLGESGLFFNTNHFSLFGIKGGNTAKASFRVGITPYCGNSTAQRVWEFTSDGTTQVAATYIISQVHGLNVSNSQIQSLYVQSDMQSYITYTTTSSGSKVFIFKKALDDADLKGVYMFASLTDGRTIKFLASKPAPTGNLQSVNQYPYRNDYYIAGLPFTDVSIDQAKLNFNNATYSGSLSGVSGYYLTTSFTNTLFATTIGSKQLFYVKLSTPITNAAGRRLIGSVSLTFKDAAIMPDGTRKDLIHTWSDISIYPYTPKAGSSQWLLLGLYLQSGTFQSGVNVFRESDVFYAGIGISHTWQVVDAGPEHTVTYFVSDIDRVAHETNLNYAYVNDDPYSSRPWMHTFIINEATSKVNVSQHASLTFNGGNGHNASGVTILSRAIDEQGYTNSFAYNSFAASSSMRTYHNSGDYTLWNPSGFPVGIRPRFRTLGSDGVFSEWKTGGPDGDFNGQLIDSIRFSDETDIVPVAERETVRWQDAAVDGNGYIIRSAPKYKRIGIAYDDDIPGYYVERFDRRNDWGIADANATVLPNSGSATINDITDASLYNVYYSPIAGSLTITKYDARTNEKLTGAEFVMSGESYYHGDFSITSVDNGDGTYTIANIPVGLATDNYILTETKAPTQDAHGNPTTYYAAGPWPYTGDQFDLDATTNAPVELTRDVYNSSEPVSLSVNKQVVDNDLSVKFPFTISITDSTGSNIYVIPDSDIKVYGANNNDITPANITRDTSNNPVIALGNGERIEIGNIPPNFKATITESDFDGYTSEISSTDSDIQATSAGSGATKPISMNKDRVVNFRNTRNTVDLTITKTVVGAGTGPFSFEITFADASGAAVNIPAPAANSGYTVSGNVASFDLNKDGSVTITGIPVGTIATIVETSHAGYTVQYNFSDGTPSVSGDTAEVTITDDLTVTCINNAGFELPHTGGTGSLILTLGGVILVATALMYGISSKRRQWRAWI